MYARPLLPCPRSKRWLELTRQLFTVPEYGDLINGRELLQAQPQTDRAQCLRGYRPLKIGTDCNHEGALRCLRCHGTRQRTRGRTLEETFVGKVWEVPADKICLVPDAQQVRIVEFIKESQVWMRGVTFKAKV